MTTQQQYYYLQELRRRALLRYVQNIKTIILNYIATGGDPTQNPELSAQYLYLENLGYFTFEDQDETLLTACAMLQRESI